MSVFSSLGFMEEILKLQIRTMWMTFLSRSSTQTLRSTSASTSSARAPKKNLSVTRRRRNLSITLSPILLMRSFFLLDLFRCNYLRGGGAVPQEENVAFLLLTSVNVYIITQKKKPAEPLRGFSLLAEHKLSELRRCIVGLFYQ
jgi:hypothetical protein